MKKKFLRNKPLYIPKITVVPEHLAKGKLKQTYLNTKLSLNLPWMGIAAMAFANYPYFYNVLFKYIDILSKS